MTPLRQKHKLQKEHVNIIITQELHKLHVLSVNQMQF